MRRNSGRLCHGTERNRNMIGPVCMVMKQNLNQLQIFSVEWMLKKLLHQQKKFLMHAIG